MVRRIDRRYVSAAMVCTAAVVLSLLSATPVQAARARHLGAPAGRRGSAPRLVGVFTTWAPATVAPPSVLPSGLPLQDEALFASACSSRGFCVSVGSIMDTQNNSFALVETLSNGVWTSAVVPTPTNTQPGHWSGRLDGVACPADGECTAVGMYNYYDPNSQVNYLVPLFDVLANGSWSSVEGPVPPGMPIGNAFVNSVSCPTTVFCMATGEFSYDSMVPVAWSWTPAGWAVDQLMEPGQLIDPILGSVSCVDQENCVAVGDYVDSAYSPQALIFTFASGAWSWMEAPLPSNATSPFGGGGTALEAVDCPQAGYCVAVGHYNNTSLVPQPLVEVLNSGVWTPSEEPVPAAPSAYQESDLTGVSCPAVGSCVATGSFSLPGSGAGFILDQTGDTWSASLAPLPPGLLRALRTGGAQALASTTSSLAGVGCDPSGLCASGGTVGTSGMVETGQISGIPSVDGVVPDSGAPGALVAVDGSNLSPTSKVRIGGIEATTTYVSPDQLVAVVPSGISCTSMVSVATGGLTTRGRSSDVFTRADCTTPGTPVDVTAMEGPTGAMVSFSPPSTDGGEALSGYVVTATDETAAGRGGQSATGTTNSVFVGGLTAGDTYTFTVAGCNSVGCGPPSGASNPVVPLAPALAIVTAGLSPATIGGAYHSSLWAVYGVGKLKWKVTAGALPRGLKLNPSGTITGVIKSGRKAPLPGDYSFTVTVTDRNRPIKDAATASLTLTVSG